MLFDLCLAQLHGMSFFSTYVPIKFTAICGLIFAVKNRAFYARIMCTAMNYKLITCA